MKTHLSTTSKNLFDISKVPTTSKITNNGDGTITVAPNLYDSGEAGKLKDIAPALKVGDVIIFDLKTTGARQVYIANYGLIGLWNNNTKILKVTEALLNNYFVFYGAGGTSGIPDTPATIYDIQIERISEETVIDAGDMKFTVLDKRYDLYHFSEGTYAFSCDSFTKGGANAPVVQLMRKVNESWSVVEWTVTDKITMIDIPEGDYGLVCYSNGLNYGDSINVTSSIQGLRVQRLNRTTPSEYQPYGYNFQRLSAAIAVPNPKNLWKCDVTKFGAERLPITYDPETGKYKIPIGEHALSRSIHQLPTPIPAGTKVRIDVYAEYGHYTDAEGKTDATITIGGYHKGSPSSWQGMCTLPRNRRLRFATWYGPYEVYSSTFTTTDTITDFWIFLNNGTVVTEDIVFKVVFTEGDTQEQYYTIQPCDILVPKKTNENLITVPQEVIAEAPSGSTYSLTYPTVSCSLEEGETYTLIWDYEVISLGHTDDFDHLKYGIIANNNGKNVAFIYGNPYSQPLVVGSKGRQTETFVAPFTGDLSYFWFIKYDAATTNYTGLKVSNVKLIKGASEWVF